MTHDDKIALIRSRYWTVRAVIDGRPWDGSFPTEAAAQSMAARLERKGYAATVVAPCDC